MRALRFYGPGDLRLEHDINEPVCGKDQIKIQPVFVGICGTDLHEYSCPTFIPSKEKPHPVTGESRPVTIGHEIAGIVVEIGSAVDRFFISVGVQGCDPVYHLLLRVFLLQRRTLQLLCKGWLCWPFWWWRRHE